jgi:hypothetical protein
VKARKPAELDMTACWWKVISGEYPDQDLIGHLEDFGKREAELEGLHADLDALPPWLEVRKAAAEHAVAQAKLYADAGNWLEGLATDALMLSRLDDLPYCLALEAREIARKVSGTA